MKIVRSHKTSQEMAIDKIDNFLEGLMLRKFPGGVKVKNAEKKWNDNKMNFSFQAKKGFLGTTISGTITIGRKNVELESQLPGLVTAAVSEDKIAKVINGEFDRLFS